MTSSFARTVGAITIALVGFVACQPRHKMQTYHPPPESKPPVAAATQTNGPPPGPPQNAPETATGPAFTPHGLVFPPEWGIPPVPAPSGLAIPGLPPFGAPPPAATTAAPMPTATAAPAPTPAPMPTATAAPAPMPTAAPAPPPAPAPTPTAAPPTDGWPPASVALEDQVLVEVNARRAAGATCGSKIFPVAPPLAMHPALSKSARGHSKDMATHNYFDHTSLDGKQPQDRMKAAGYLGLGYSGENIAAGNATAKDTVQQWMKSPGHCENIMDPKYQLLGVGYAWAGTAKYKHYWTQNFAGN